MAKSRKTRQSIAPASQNLMDEVVVVGDLNFHFDVPSDNNVQNLQTLFSDRGLSQMISEPTQRRGHTLDVLITSENARVDKVIVHDNLLLDHKTVYFTLDASLSRRPQRTVSSRNLKQTTTPEFAEDIVSVCSDLISSNSECSSAEMVEFYNASLQGLTDKHAPVTTKRVTDRPSAPWLDDKENDAIRNRRKAEDMWRDTGQQKLEKTKSEKLTTRLVKFEKQFSLGEEEEQEEPFDVNTMGNFEKDFNSLCRRKKFLFTPDIVPRPHPPCVLELNKRGMLDKKTKKITKLRPKANDLREASPGRRGKSQNHLDRKPRSNGRVNKDELAPDLELNSRHGSSGDVSARVKEDEMQCIVDSAEFRQHFTTNQPITYTTKNRLEYFTPCIQVEKAVPNDNTTVTEIYVRGWKVDEAMMDVFQLCWPHMSHLRQVHMWDTALDPHTFASLASFLPMCLSLNTLVLDNNRLTNYPVSRLLAENSLLEHLSLRFCELSDIEAAGIGTQLVSPNHRLLTLNLSNNRICNQGTIKIAEGLRVNRTLLVLNLAYNSITDDGAVALSVALTLFPLSHEQLVERRRLTSRKELSSVGRHHNVSFYQTGLDRRGSGVGYNAQRKNSGKDRKNSSSQRKDMTNFQREVKISVKPPPKGSSFAKSKSKWDRSDSSRLGQADTQNTKLRVNATKPRHRKRSNNSPADMSGEADPAVEAFNNSPLTDVGYHRGDELLVPGSRSLISLNVSGNKVGERGLQALLCMVEDQGKPIHGCRQMTKGLMRLVVHRTGVPDNSPTVLAIHRYMRLRDPHFHSPCIDLTRPSVTPCSMPLAL